MLMNTLLEIRNYSETEKWVKALNNLFAMNTLTVSVHTIASCIVSLMNPDWEMI